jgi:restriction endonuclease Mrr
MKSFLCTIRNHKGIFITTSDFTKDAKFRGFIF